MTSATLRRARLVYVDGLRGMRPAFALFFLILIVIFGGIGLIVAMTGENGAWGSIWEPAMYGSRYFPLSMGVVLLSAFLPVATAHGVSRTSYLLGVAALMCTMAAAVSIFLAAGQWVEYRLFAAAGEEQEYGSPHLFSSGREVGWVLVESFVVVPANIVAGFFLGAAYYKWRWLRATLTLPVLLAPLVTVEALMQSGFAGNVMESLFDIGRGPLGIVIPASVAIIAGMLAATLVILRTTDVRTSTR